MRATGYEALSNELVDNGKLELQAEGENTQALIDALPLGGVRSVLDVGCGSGAMTRALARRLGPDVDVCGLDVSPGHVGYARRLAAEGGLPNVRYVLGDILAAPAGRAERFDLVFEKYVLMAMAPRRLGGPFLSGMRGRARPGGRVVCIEADINFGQERFPPPPRDLARVLRRVVTYYRRRGLIEWRCGVRLYSLLKRAGFSRVEVKLVDGRVIAGGRPAQLAEHDSIDVEQLLRPCLEEMGLGGQTDFYARRWREYLFGPDNFLYTPVFMGVGAAD